VETARWADIEPISRLDHLTISTALSSVFIEYIGQDRAAAASGSGDGTTVLVVGVYLLTNVERMLGIVLSVAFDGIQTRKGCFIDFVDLSDDSPVAGYDPRETSKVEHFETICECHFMKALTTIEYTEARVTLTKGSVHKHVHVVLLIRY
jgi:hypothetical protein